MPTTKKFHMVQLLVILLFASASLRSQTTRPESERKLAHDIYKEFVEIQSGFTTGATTPVAETAAARLRAAGFPESALFVAGANPKKSNLLVLHPPTRTLNPILL